MSPRRSRRVCAVVCAVCVASVAGAPQHEPQVGQPGKDVVWVPTADVLVQKMLDLAQVAAGDSLIDLGSGDGRTVIAAAKRGARAVGVEYEPQMVELSRRRAAEANANVTFVQGDLFDQDLSSASVITMFLLPQINLKLRPKLLELKPGTRIVSNTFTMDDWVPDEQATVQDGCATWCTALLWIVPAKIEGTWRSADGALTLRQQFQMVEGSIVATDGTSKPVSGKVRGTDLILSANGVLYEGRVQGDTIQGRTLVGATNHAWTATRASR